MLPFSRRLKTATIGIATAALFTTMMASPANADTAQELSSVQISEQVAEAATDAGAPQATAAVSVTDSAEGVSTKLAGAATLTVPNADVTGSSSTATVLDGPGDSQAVVQQVGNGLSDFERGVLT